MGYYSYASLTIFKKYFIFDVKHGSEYVSVSQHKQI